VFTVGERDRLRERVLELARTDPRVVAGAVVGAQAVGPGDRWSDLDLTFGIQEGVPVDDVLADFTRAIEEEVGAVPLFDLPRGQAIYRVFLVPGLLQVDLSFAPASEFGPRGPKFALLFGEAVEAPQIEQPQAREVFGLAVHHAMRARICIERGKLWQAEFWLSALRDHALELACLRRGLDASWGSGFDALPPEVQAEFEGAIVRRLAPDELLRALAVATEGLLREGVEAGEVVARVEPELRVLTA
jgi:hypothetical protein